MYLEYHMTATGATVIYRAADKVWIPLIAGNLDYDKYLEWVEAGNVAEIVTV